MRISRCGIIHHMDGDGLGATQFATDSRTADFAAQHRSDQGMVTDFEATGIVDRAVIAQLEADRVRDRERIAHLETALVTARRIGAAIGIVMAGSKVSEERAFQMLREASQHQNRKLRDVADDVLLTGTIQ